MCVRPEERKLHVRACRQHAVPLKRRYSAGGVAHVLFSVSVGSSAVLTDLLARMNDGGMPTRDISGIEAAQVPLPAEAALGSQ